MKKLIAILMLSVLPLAYADCHAAEEKKVCVKEFDNKTKKEKEVCRTIKIHKKLEGTKIDDVKKQEADKKKK
jgi:hypothetical protein